MPTLYVNASGGLDSRTYTQAQNPATPWATIYRAAKGAAPGNADNTVQAAQAGDTVLVMQGIYSIAGSNDNSLPVYNPVNDGTAGNYIKFQGLGQVVLRLSSGRGAVIGSDEQSYIWWEHFYIDEEYANSLPDMGPAVLSNCDNCVITRCTFDGTIPFWIGVGGDNHNAVRFEGATNCTVSHNRIRNVVASDGSTGTNAAGIMTYLNTNSGNVIEYNTITGCGSGIYLKNAWGTNGGNITVRYNFIDRCATGILIGNTEDSLIHQNIIANGLAHGYEGGETNHGIRFASEGVRNNYIVNNTIYNCQYGWVRFPVEATSGIDAWTMNYFRNNIFANFTTSGFPDGNNESAFLTTIRNVYNNFTNFHESGNGHTSLAAWQAATGYDANSSHSDPLFVNAAAGDFRLTNSGQAARTIGRAIAGIGGADDTIIPAGAYITGNEIIGVHDAVTSTRRFMYFA